MKQAIVLFGTTAMGMPEFSADLLWRTGGYSVPDPILFFEIEGKTILLASSLEIERAAKEAKVDEIVPLESFISKAEKEKTAIAVVFLKEHGIEEIIIPRTIRYSLGRELEKHFTIIVKDPPFYPERAKKRSDEIVEIEKAQRAGERAVGEGMNFLRECQIKGDELFHAEFGSTPIASHDLRKIIDDALYRLGYLGVESIVACGAEAADPHSKGYGLLRPHLPIVLDIFPRSLTTLYFADQTRTLFKGEPSEKLKKMYQAVLRAQEKAIEMVRPDADGGSIDAAVRDFFKKEGYMTNVSVRPVSGFIHSLGHGVGIDIHEEPSLGRRGSKLEEGNIVTVEPGLYYPIETETIPAGGIRIEDMIVVTKDSCRNLTQFPKRLGEMIL